MQKSLVTGIDIGSNKTRVLVCEVSPDSPEPRVVGFGSAVTKGLHHGYVINRHHVVQSIRSAVREAEKDSGVKIKDAYVAIGGISLASHRVATTLSLGSEPHTVTERDLERALDYCETKLLHNRQNIHILHAIPLNYKLDGQDVLGQPLGLTANTLTLQALFVVSHEHHFEDLVGVVHEAGISVIDVVAAPIASALATLTHTDKMAGAAVVDLGAETLSIAVFDDNKVISLDVFAIGSTDITNDIALGFQIPLQEAESMKTQTLDQKVAKKFSKSRLDDIIRARLADIFELVEKHLEGIKKNHLLPAGLVLTGGGSALVDFDEQAKDILRLPVRTARIDRIKQVKKPLPDTTWFVTLGLCRLVHEEFDIRYRQPSALQILWKQMKQWIAKNLKQLLP